jgi:membrane-associated phospholipid phosphatase
MALGVGTLAFAAFAALGAAHLVGALDRLDEAAARALHEAPPAWLDPVIAVASAAGSVPLLAGAALVAAALLFRKHRDSDATLIVVALIGCGIVTGVVKLAFDAARSRPDPVVDLEWLAFPSGHVSIASAVYGAFALIAWRRLRRPATRAAVAFAALMLVAGVGFSRLTLGAHYLSDVLAGFACGAGSLAFCVALLAYARDVDLRKLARRRLAHRRLVR